MSWIGRSLPRLEDPALVKGAGNYVADLSLGAASVRFVRSPVAAGAILGIEKPENALAFTAADPGGVKGIRPILHRPDYVAVEQPILARDRVMFAGQAVVAEDHASAEDEEIVYDEFGNYLPTSLADFLPPTMHEIPPIEIIHSYTRSDASITKAKGVGEGGLMGAPACVINAIVGALSPFGVEIFEMPATPQRILELIRGKRA